ncbi:MULTISPECIES: ferredoxin [Actinomadura]|uniref:Ferredoxin n=1 Tax=Actinomadura miaoliensis TaxID=430685 RepID=A0ABP7WMX0_9ACTN
MGETRWKVHVDRDACVSSGNCVALAAERFELTDDGARPLQEILVADEAVVEAAEACPMEAITVVDAADGSEVAP